MLKKKRKKEREREIEALSRTHYSTMNFNNFFYDQSHSLKALVFPMVTIPMNIKGIRTL